MGDTKLPRPPIKPHDTIFYLHIPKTGGTTLYQALSGLFPQNQVLMVPDLQIQAYYSSTRPESLAACRFVRQHADYDFYRYLPRKPLYFTMLRNPITRVVSLYRHVCRVKSHPLHRTVVDRGISLVDFVTDVARAQTSNLQVKFLVGSGSFIEHDQNDLLQIARMRLFEFTFVGIMELYPESILLLEALLGCQLGNLKPQNQAPQQTRQETLTSEEERIISGLNTLDLAMYEEAVSVINARTRQLVQISGEEEKA